MPVQITLTPLQGNLENKDIVLYKRGRYIVGRAQDCDICLRGPDLSSVSRHHCVLEVEPPGISVRDLGSRNGTIVNGESIGQRALANPVDESALDDSFLSVELNDGDEVRIGRLLFRVSILDPSDLFANSLPANFF